MKNYSYKDSLRWSITRTRQMLFSPFNTKKWLKFIFIGIFAGTLLNSGLNGFPGGGNFLQPAQPENEVNIPALPGTQTAIPVNAKAPQETTASAVTSSQNSTVPSADTILPAATTEIPNPGPIFWIILTAILIPLSLLFIWIGSRMQFVWLQAILKNYTEVKTPFRQYKTQGNSLFKFALLFPLCFVAVITALLLIPGVLGYQAGAFQEGFQPTTMQITFLVALPIAVLIAILIAVFFVMLNIQSFVFPMMAFDDTTFIPAFKKWHLMYKSHKKELWKYFFLRILLGIVQAITELFLLLAASLVVLIPAALLIALFYFIFVAVLKATTLFVIAGSLVAIPFAFLWIVAMMGTKLPFAVFYQNLSFNVLASFDSAYPRVNPE